MSTPIKLQAQVLLCTWEELTFSIRLSSGERILYSLSLQKNAWGVVVIWTRRRTPLSGYFAICIPDGKIFSSCSVDTSRGEKNPLQGWRILLLVSTNSISPCSCPSDNPIIYWFSFIVSPDNKDRMRVHLPSGDTDMHLTIIEKQRYTVYTKISWYATVQKKH